jgi:hypothetical protein
LVLSYVWLSVATITTVEVLGGRSSRTTEWLETGSGRAAAIDWIGQATGNDRRNSRLTGDGAGKSELDYLRRDLPGVGDARRETWPVSQV